MVTTKSDEATVVPAEEFPDPEPTAKSKPDAAWKQGEVPVLPKNRIGIVLTGFAGVLGLAAIDQVCPITSTHRLLSLC
jgi:hypothetical protein